MATSTVEQVQFPLLNHWADYIYRPCTIPYRFPSDPPHQATRTEVLWLEVFRKSIPSFRKRAELDGTVADASEKAEKFALRYGKILDDIQSNPEKHGGPPDGIVSAPTFVLPYQLQPKGLRYTRHHKMSFYSPWVYPPVYVEVSVNLIVGVWNWTTLVASVNSQPARQAAT
jgi:hypothetical protein